MQLRERSDERESLVRYYENMSPAKRRERILLQPAYRDAYNEITEAHQRVEQSRYFWRRWVPVLGPTAAMVYMRLRDVSFSHGGEAAGLCGISQEELARDLGGLDVKTIRAALKALEEHGFITREKVYGDPNPRTGRAHRLPDRISVYFEIPLATEDAVELLVLESSQAAIEYADTGKISPNGEPIPGNSPCIGSRPQLIENSRYRENFPSNVRKTNGTDRCLSPVFVDSPDAIVEDLIEALGEPHSSRFFHLVATRMPETVIRRLLSETKAARLEGILRKTPGAFFTAAVKREARELGVSLMGKSARTT